MPDGTGPYSFFKRMGKIILGYDLSQQIIVNRIFVNSTDSDRTDKAVKF